MVLPMAIKNKFFNVTKKVTKYLTLFIYYYFLYKKKSELPKLSICWPIKMLPSSWKKNRKSCVKYRISLSDHFEINDPPHSSLLPALRVANILPDKGNYRTEECKLASRPGVGCTPWQIGHIKSHNLCDLTSSERL